VHAGPVRHGSIEMIMKWLEDFTQCIMHWRWNRWCSGEDAINWVHFWLKSLATNTRSALLSSWCHAAYEILSWLVSYEIASGLWCSAPIFSCPLALELLWGVLVNLLSFLTLNWHHSPQVLTSLLVSNAENLYWHHQSWVQWVPGMLKLWSNPSCGP